MNWKRIKGKVCWFIIRIGLGIGFYPKGLAGISPNDKRMNKVYDIFGK